MEKGNGYPFIMKDYLTVSALTAAILILPAPIVTAQGFEPEEVFKVKVFRDREPAVIGEVLRLAIEVRIDVGWHINSDTPGDEFSLPTTIAFGLPEGWPDPEVAFPDGENIKFEFSDTPIEVWEGRIYLLANLTVPETSEEKVRLTAEVTAQACNDAQCLPPTPVRAGIDVVVAPAGSAGTSINKEIFKKAEARATAASETVAVDTSKGPVSRTQGLVIGAVLLVAGFIVLVVLRLGQASPTSDRLMRLVCLLVLAGATILVVRAGTVEKVHLEWAQFEPSAVTSAISSGDPVILDFSADWCPPCRELDEKTFPHPQVTEKLAPFARFKANLTKVTDETDLLRREYGVVGFPTIIVYQGGSESFRLTGFEPPQQFLRRFGTEVVEDDVEGRLAAAALPLKILLVFLAGLALNLTPCIYPLIPITIGFFSQQAKDRTGGTFGLAVAYVLGISVTYSVVGVLAAMTGQLFGSALQNPFVIGVVVIVLLALAASMFGLWELRVPGWAASASGGRGGYLGSTLMGLMVGFVAAPCIGPFVLGLITYVGQQGSPLLGFVLFFSLSTGLGLPYLLLGTFAGAVNRLPASGMWMIGVRKVFGILLVALAAYFAEPLLGSFVGGALMNSILIVGGAYLLLVERTGHEQPPIDRAMRLVSVALVLVGLAKML